MNAYPLNIATAVSPLLPPLVNCNTLGRLGPTLPQKTLFQYRHWQHPPRLLDTKHRAHVAEVTRAVRYGMKATSSDISCLKGPSLTLSFSRRSLSAQAGRKMLVTRTLRQAAEGGSPRLRRPCSRAPRRKRLGCRISP